MEECIFVLILGRNNNPSTIEFTTSLKKIVLGATHKSQFSNCLIQDDTANIPLPSNLEETFVLNEMELENEDESQCTQYIDSIATSSEYKSDILVYIAGYIQQAIIKKEECFECKLYLTNMKIVESSLILNIKNRGPLCIPSAEFVKIIKVAHSLVEKRLSDKDILTEINVVEKLTNKTVRILNTLYPSLLNKLSDHADSCSITNNHKINLMKKISKQYISAVLKHFCRQHNNKDTKIRKLYSKLILFKNQ